MAITLHRIKKAVRNAPNLLRGYNLYVDSDKLKLIDFSLRTAYPSARTFADLGGVWKVNGGYSRYAARRPQITRGFLVDTDFPPQVRTQLEREPRLQLISGDFTSNDVAQQIGQVDVVFLFDVLLHQANPSWVDVLGMYARIAPCISIFNQQYVRGNSTVRLTSLSLDEYMSIAPKGREDVYRYVYAHADEIHPEYRKPWRDIHNVFQWGITDNDLRRVMSMLGYREVFYRSYGRFSDLPAFENHGFVFVRR
jgi:hypothetical protein